MLRFTTKLLGSVKEIDCEFLMRAGSAGERLPQTVADVKEKSSVAANRTAD
jgi:hypothetical protein